MVTTLRGICLYEPQWEMIRWPLIPHVESAGGCVPSLSRLFLQTFPTSASRSEWRMAVDLLEVRDGCTCVCVQVCRVEAWPLTSADPAWDKDFAVAAGTPFLLSFFHSRMEGFQKVSVHCYSEQNAFSPFIGLFSVLNDGRFIKVTNSGVSVSSLLYLIILFYKVSRGENVVLIVCFIKVPLFPTK